MQFAVLHETKPWNIKGCLPVFRSHILFLVLFMSLRRSMQKRSHLATIRPSWSKCIETPLALPKTMRVILLLFFFSHVVEFCHITKSIFTVDVANHDTWHWRHGIFGGRLQKGVCSGHWAQITRVGGEILSCTMHKLMHVHKIWPIPNQEKNQENNLFVPYPVIWIWTLFH